MRGRLVSFNTELLRRISKPVVCVEIQLDTGSLYFADRDFREADTFWDGRIISTNQIARGVGLDKSQGLIIGDFSVTLWNNDPDNATGSGYFGEILPKVNTWLGTKCIVYLKFIDDDNVVWSDQIFEGTCVPQMLDAETLSLDIRPAIRERLSLLQRSIQGYEFSDALGAYSAPDETIGTALNIILGTVSANNGAVFCPMIDDTTNSEKFCVAQHAVKSVDAVYRKRADAFALLTLTTHYTVTKTALDNDGNRFSYITIASGIFAEGDEYYINAKGLEDNGDGTGTLYEKPAEALEQLFLQFSQITSSDIDSTSFSAATATCTARNYDDTGYFGTCIPFDDSGNRLEGGDSPWGVVQEIAEGFHHKLYLTRDGKLGLTSIDITASGSPSVYYRERSGDFEDDIEVQFYPLKAVNLRHELWQVAHSSEAGSQGHTLGSNASSQASALGLVEIENINRTAQNDEVLQDILGREMLLTSGNAIEITWTVPGLWGLQDNSDIGDLVALTHARAFGGWTDQHVQITAIAVDPLNGKVKLTGLPLGSSFYQGVVLIKSIAIQQIETTLYPLDTYVDYSFATTSYGSTTPIRCGGDDTSGWLISGNLSRTGYRFDLSSIPAGSTILSVSMEIYVEAQYYPSQLRIHRLNETTWGANSTWNSFTNNGAGSAWTDSYISTQLCDDVSAGIGKKTKIFNSSGITYVQNALDGDGYVQTTHNAMNRYEGYLITSAEGTSSNRPKLIILYLAP
jgi:hypothetical protein